MQSLKQILTYHGQTKHHPHKYANSLGYLDWANQPNPYRKYSTNTAHHLEIPPASLDASIAAINENTQTQQAINSTSLSSLLYYAFALAAIKSSGNDSWALRMNASSGNLHPTEAYVIAPDSIDTTLSAGIYHYSSDMHILEALAPLESTSNVDHFYIALSSVLYREIWKYGERAFRYCQLDTGHAIEALRMSAAMLGWQVHIVPNITTQEIAEIIGLSLTQRFEPKELEVADLLIEISLTSDEATLPEISAPLTFDNAANHLASTYQQWPIIEQTEQAAKGAISPKNLQQASGVLYSSSSHSYASLITTRRSAQRMNKEAPAMALNTFLHILEDTKAQLLFTPTINLFLFIHNVATLESGLYLYLRDETALDMLKASLHQSFQFKEVAPSLFLLEAGRFQTHAKAVSCSQDIASDSHFSLGMVAPFANELETYGSHRYKELFYECGYIGQRLYLSATAYGYDGTGIGCFLDDIFHQMLGITTGSLQSLYHFTIGKAVRDDRIVSQKPYAMRR